MNSHGLLALRIITHVSYERRFSMTEIITTLIKVVGLFLIVSMICFTIKVIVTGWYFKAGSVKGLALSRNYLTLLCGYLYIWKGGLNDYVNDYCQYCCVDNFDAADHCYWYWSRYHWNIAAVLGYYHSSIDNRRYC